MGGPGCVQVAKQRTQALSPRATLLWSQTTHRQRLSEASSPLGMVKQSHPSTAHPLRHLPLAPDCHTSARHTARAAGCTQAVVLRQLAVYFDVGLPLLRPPRGGGVWSGAVAAALTPAEWDALFLPAHHLPPLPPPPSSASSSSALPPPGAATAPAGAATAAAPAGPAGVVPYGRPLYDHHHLVLPISGRMTYIHRWVRLAGSQLGIVRYRFSLDSGALPLAPVYGTEP